MARQESDREDILREATALIERAELRIPDFGEAVIVGFRRDGSASVFFGPDPVYQFNSRSELRRAFVDGQLLKAEDGRLASLRRERTSDAVHLVRHDFTDVEQNTLLASMHAQLQSLRSAIEANQASVVGQVPAERDVLGRIKQWLEQLPATISIAARPNVQ